MSRIERPEENHLGWWKSGICGPGPYSVQELPGTTGRTGAFYVADAKGVNCWTQGTGRVVSSQAEAQAVADHWNSEGKA